ncbi:Blastomyces yeast-phase-specific protein [Penicillium italicum]|uniref:Blastomyces yeast-phase-specific protein n=1 Tax=Penicillium italicum TaxID=40296 RepID=A0A0A2L452_PENIT|nr:Blastomyces yeast-phase-specific protein [Penicillium italicum]
MHLSTVVPLLSLTTLALSTPTIQNNNHQGPRDISFSAFPSSSSSGPVRPLSTPPPAHRNLGHAKVRNNCKFPVYLWSVASTVLPERTLLPNDEYNEVFRENTDTGGIAIKISTDRDGLYSSAPQMIFAYNLSSSKERGLRQDKVWYDLSDVFGDPFEGYPVNLTPSEPLISWEDGVPPAGSQVRVVDSSTDLVLSLC